MSDKLLDFLESTFLLVIIIVEIGLVTLLTLRNIKLVTSFIEHL